MGEPFPQNPDAPVAERLTFYRDEVRKSEASIERQKALLERLKANPSASPSSVEFVRRGIQWSRRALLNAQNHVKKGY